MLPFYKIVVNETDETGIDFNSLVDSPAHMKAFISFGKQPIKYHFNEEKRIITGVMISVGTPIYRNSPDLGEHYVVFDAPTVDLIRRKFFKNGFIQNLNKQHNANSVIKGAVLVDSYIASNSDSKLPNFPESFKDQNLQDGSWIASYYIEDNALWQDVKEGKFVGFSVEGLFERTKLNVKKTKMSKETKSVKQYLKDFFNGTEETPAVEVTFTEATTADGIVVFYDGELAEGTLVQVELDGVKVPAPEGEHQLTLADGTVKIVTLDGTGAVVSIADAMQSEDSSEESTGEMSKEIAEILSATIKGVDAKFEAMEAKFKAIQSENDSLKNEIEAIKSADNFGAQPKKAGEKTTMSASDILKMKK